MEEIVIIGGGASGLIAAISAARKGKKVTILEKNNICGKKILVTGNGRCNYTNKDQDIKHYRSCNIELAKKVITEQNHEKVLEFFNQIGIVPKIKNGYYYPYSNQAVSIQNALLTEIKNLNIEVKNNVTVEKVKKDNNGYVIITNQEQFYASELIIATGSKAASNTGTEGIGYEICERLGHTVIKPLPALVQLKGNEKYFKEWAGIRVEAKIEAYEDDIKQAEDKGEIQLTNYGISGICVMNLSGRIARGIDGKKKECVKINFLDGLNINTEKECMDFISKRNQIMKNRTICELLEGVINYKLINVLLKKCGINNNKKWNEIAENKKQEFIKNIINLEIEITGTNSFENAQVCSGGIPLNEVNTNTLESLKSEGLYIIGELLDIDGDCGGYNLTWAWITGMIAGENI